MILRDDGQCHVLNVLNLDLIPGCSQINVVVELFSASGSVRGSHFEDTGK